MKLAVHRGLRNAGLRIPRCVGFAALARSSARRLPAAPRRPNGPRSGRSGRSSSRRASSGRCPTGCASSSRAQAAIPKVSITLTVLSGYSSDPADLTGLASLTADLIQEGTKTKSSRQIRREVFGMGGSLTAAASQDYTSISARGLSEFAPQLDRPRRRRGDEPDDSRRRSRDPEAAAPAAGVSSRRRRRSSSRTATFRSALFGDHPYARTSETEASLKAMDRAKLVAFHRDHYRPNNAFLLVVGAIEPEAVIAAAEKAFGGWARGDVPTPSFAAAAAADRAEGLLRPAAEQHPVVDCARQRRGRSGAIRAGTSCTLANTIYGGAFNSRIVRNIREEKGYTYSPQSALTGFADAGFYRFAADVRNDVTGATLTEVFKEIDKMRAEGSDGPELQGREAVPARHLPDPDRDAERAVGDVEQRLRLRAAEGLPGDVPGEDRARSRRRR